jgi:hypothetical protein
MLYWGAPGSGGRTDPAATDGRTFTGRIARRAAATPSNTMSTVEEEQLVPGHSIVRSLSAGPNGAVLLGKQAGSGREVLVKTFRPALLLGGEAERAVRRRRVSAFLTVARVQQELSTSAKHWAPVHAFGPLADAGDDGAYYTTDEYPASASWLIRGHVPLNPATLCKVVSGVIVALAEMRECCGRGHGNLTPGNVLLSDRDPRSARVLLTDPSPEPPAEGGAAGDDEADDRWAVGALIYGLVTHKPVRRMTLLPATPDADWAPLGRDAGRWLSLCGRLMARDPAERPDLAVVLAELAPSVKKSSAGRVLRWAAAAIVLVAAAGGAAVGGYVYLYHKAIANLGDIDKPWVTSLVAIRADPAMAADPSFHRDHLPDLLDEVARTGHVGPTGGRLVPSYAAFTAARSASGTLDAIHLALRPDHWQLLADVQALRARASQAQWTGVVADLQQLTAGLPPAGEDQAGRQLKQFLALAPGRLARDRQLAPKWAEFAGDVDALTTAASNVSDAAAGQVAATLKTRLAATVRLDADDQLDATGQNLSVAGLTCNALADFVAKVDTIDDYKAVCDRIRGLVNPGGGAAPADVEGWLEQLKGHVGVDLAQVPAFTGIGADLTQDKPVLDRVPADDAGKPDLQKRWDAAARQYDAIRKRQWTRSDQPDLDQQCAVISGQLTALVADARAALAVGQWLASVRQQSAATVPPDDVGWQAAVAGLADERRQLAGHPALFTTRQRAVAAWLAVRPQLGPLVRAGAQLPPPFAGPVQDRRVREWWAALPAVTFDSSTVPTPQELVEVARARQPAWSAEVARFAETFPLKLRWTDLRAGDAIAQVWPGKDGSDDRQFWDAEVAAPAGSLHVLPWLASDVARLGVFQATAAMDREQLVAACEPSNPVETALVAHLRLDAMDGGTTRPRTPAELAMAAGWLAPVSAAANALGLTPADLAAYAAAQRQAWPWFAAHAASPADVAAAVADARAFGVNVSNVDVWHKDDVFTVLSDQPTAAYNILVCRSCQARTPDVMLLSDLAKAIGSLAPPDQLRIYAELKMDPAQPVYPSADQTIAAIHNDTWYRWPSVPFAPRAARPVVRPVAVVASNNSGGGRNSNTPGTPAASGGTPAGGGTAAPVSSETPSTSRRGPVHRLTP